MRRVVLASCLVFGFVATNSLAWSPTTPEIAVAKFGSTGEDKGYSVAVDSSGNIYTTGIFSGTVDFDPGAGTANLTSAGSWDVFLSKLNSAGELVWVKKFGSTAADQGRAIAVDTLGNVYTTGSFSGTVDFDPGAGTSNLFSGQDAVFVLKLNSAGEFVWAKQLNESWTSVAYGYSIAVDSSGNVYTTGNFRGTVDFDPGAGASNLTSAGATGNVDAFVSKLDLTGAFVWVKQFTGTGNKDEFGYSIAVDSSGNVYTTGYFSGTTDFDPDPAGGAVANLTSANGDDVFVSKLNSTGAFVWVKQFGGTASEQGRSIAVDSSRNVYTTGFFQGTADFDPDPAGGAVANLTTAGGWDVFVSKLDATGAFVWAKQFSGTGSFDQGNSIAVDSSGNVYTTGNFRGTVDFDPGAGTANLVSSDGADVFATDVFVSKLSSAGAAVSATTTTTSTTTTTPAQAEEARRLEESRNAFELSERCRKANHAFNDCPLWPGNVTTSTSTSSTTSTTTPATSSTTSTTTSATSSTTLTTTPATSLTTSTTTPLKNSTPTTSPTVVTKQSLSLKVSFAQSSRRLSKPAQTNLQVLVNRLNQASNISITCSGTMTLSEIQNSKRLARNRATSVCAKLRSLGLKATFNTTSNPISKLTKNQGRFVVVAATYSSD